MENNSENTNYNSVIETKKSLKRTIIQLQKAIDIINQEKISDIPNLKVVDKLVESSNALIDYLQLKNNNLEEASPSKLPKESDLENEVIDLTSSKDKPVYKTKKVAKKQSSFSLTNIILVGVLAVSISFNILNFVSPSTNKIPVEKAIDNPVTNPVTEENQIAEKPPLKTSLDLPDNSIVSPETNNSRAEETTSNTEINNEIVAENNPINLSENLDKVIPDNQENIDNKPENDLSIDITNIDNKKEEQEKEIEITPENEPEESLILMNPEQYLLKNIKEQIDLITNKYGKKIINKIEVNINNNSLIIEISNDWYNFNENTQNNLVNDIVVKVKSLDFYKFNLIDGDRNLLARNAIVGNEYIITKRTIDYQ